MRWLMAEAGARVPSSARKADEPAGMPAPSSPFNHDNSHARTHAQTHAQTSGVPERRESAAF
jgi:hypothetical protein